MVNRIVHFLLRCRHDCVWHYLLLLTTVPISSPWTAFLMFPSSIIENTTSGISLSIHNVEAVESITSKPWLMTSKNDSSVYFTASLSTIGSAEYTPSTLFF